MYKSILFLPTLVASVIAQGSTSVSIVSSATQSMPVSATQAFNPALVNGTQEAQWCRAQRNTCTDICNGRWARNDCDETRLTYACTCLNGTIPDCSQFTQSLPFYICQETYIQCINAHPSTDPEGQQQCVQNAKCGTRNATAERATTGTSTTSSASSASGSATGSASASGASATSSKAAAASIGPVTNGAFVALLLALCKLVL